MKAETNLTNKDFFKKIYDEHFEKLFYFSKKFVKSDDIAKDILSEVFYNCWNHIDKLRKIENIRSYLYTCVRNESNKFLRSQFKKMVIPIEDNEWETIYNFAIENYTPEQFILQKELQGLIENTIENLPQQCKMVFRMVKEDGLKHDEVATILSISPNTVKNHVIKALKKIRVALELYITDSQRNNKQDAKIISIKTVQAIIQFGLFI